MSCLFILILGISGRMTQTMKTEEQTVFDSLLHTKTLITSPALRGILRLKKRIVHYLKLPEFSGKSIKFVYEQLSTRGVYFASPSSWYRVARKHGLISKKKPVANKPKESTLSTAVRLGLVATKPNQVWNWDISYFPYKGGNEMVYLFAVIRSRQQKVRRRKVLY